jgi:hypothetical protein
MNVNGLSNEKPSSIGITGSRSPQRDEPRPGRRAPCPGGSEIRGTVAEMPKVLVTGMSGTGKSSALVALARRGYRVVDTDAPGWTEWVASPEKMGGGEWQELILHDLATVEPMLRSGCTHELEASRPLDEVVADLIAISEASTEAS